ncbi:acetylglutamate kinase [Bacillus sp. CLL-7-23]|uniref:Acetylglutamate kinase n=1 Tax=Bacillus changyiensis TaxID=3004103 RepID=A0ABT4X1A2_9BACI|nr:acetylglutamate kinase [Bacillus changyiensis]MDA7026072.1 acetylglutamate kinase [Bacillus changyiensis]
MKKIIVFKCGGSVIRQLSASFFANLRELIEQGWKIVIVHGGGPEISSMLSRLNIETEFSQGQRKTTNAVLEVTEMVLTGSINKFIVSELIKHGLDAVGISGVDGQLLLADYLNEKEYGQVGRVKKVNSEIIDIALNNGFIPVISPISLTETGEKLNVNADLVASAVADALHADQLLFVTDVKGILKDGNLLSSTTPEELEILIVNGVVSGGMIPKVRAAIAALSNDINEVMIISGKASFLTKKMFIGTKIKRQLEGV